MTVQEIAEQSLKSLLASLGFSADIEVTEADGIVCLNISSPDSQYIIGGDGDRLDDLQYLVNRMIQRKMEDAPRVKVDCDHYRERNEARLLEKARSLAERVQADEDAAAERLPPPPGAQCPSIHGRHCDGIRGRRRPLQAHYHPARLKPAVFMKVAAVIASVCLALVTAVPGRAEAEDSPASCAPPPSPPPPVLVVYGSAEPGAAEARWLKALRPGTEERRALDEHVRDVQFVTVPKRPSVKDWEEGGSLSRAAEHGVRVLPAVVLLDSRGRVFDLVEGGAHAASLREKAALLADKARRVRPVTLVNDVPKGGDPAEEAAAICRALEPVPAEAWFRDYPGTMKRLEKLNCTVPAFLNARAAARRLEKNRETAALLCESFQACDAPSIRKCLEAWRKRADDPSLPLEERQLILLSMVHPLWVRLEEALYRDAHTAESEEAFNRAVAVLEEVRDMDRASVCGRRAHQLREELRRARLAAARYD